MVDSKGKSVKLFPSMIPVLSMLWENDIHVAIVANTNYTCDLEQIISLLGWDKYIDDKQMYPDSLEAHLNK